MTDLIKQTEVKRQYMVNMYCRFYYKFNYRVEERTGEIQFTFTYSQNHFYQEKKRTKNIKILVKNTSEHLKEEVGTIDSITSEDKCKIFCTFVTTTLLCREEGTTWKTFIS